MPTADSFIKNYPCLTYGKKTSNYHIKEYDINPSKTNIHFVYQNNDYQITTNLTSQFNVYNYILALAIVHEYGNTDYTIVYEVVINNIKPLRDVLETLG